MLWCRGEKSCLVSKTDRVVGHCAREVLTELNYSQFFSSPIFFDGQMRRSKVRQHGREAVVTRWKLG
jgi:hypothetical protein